MSDIIEINKPAEPPACIYKVEHYESSNGLIVKLIENIETNEIMYFGEATLGVKTQAGVMQMPLKFKIEGAASLGDAFELHQGCAQKAAKAQLDALEAQQRKIQIAQGAQAVQGNGQNFPPFRRR